MNAYHEDNAASYSFGRIERARLVNRALDVSGVAPHGKATAISLATGVSKATAAGWLKGSLPRDCTNLIDFSDKYDINIYEWITGTARKETMNMEKLQNCIEVILKFQESENIDLSASQISKLSCMLYADESKAKYLLDNIKMFM